MKQFLRFATAAAFVCVAACSTTGSEPVGCATGQLACGTVCVTPATDLANCGNCGNACAVPAGGSAACVSGACQVVCAAGQTTCGGADAGEALACATLVSDPRNCGGCGVACAGTEVCSDSRCAPCPIAQCNNVCTDTQHDAQNCGACGAACTGTQACLDGACAATISIALSGAASLGFVENAEQFPVEVTVTSQYRVAGVTVDGPPINQLADGSFNRHADLTFEGLNIDATQTQWTFPLPVINPGTWDGGMTFTATDEVFRADAGDAAAHQATLTASVQLILPPTTGALQPTISVSSGATALPANSFIPLDAAPITLTATWPALPAGVAQAAFIS